MVPPPFRVPRPELAPDLDMRPGEPARSTLPRWLQVCRCGAAAPDLALLPASARPIVESPEYQAWNGTSAFRCWAILCHAAGDTRSEAEALLQAAWAADDAGDVAAARAARLEAAVLWAETPDTALQRLDALRRAGDFDAAEVWADILTGRGLDETSRAIVAFQRARAAAGDTGRHTIGAALPPPAHVPHVSHGRRPQRGFLARLFGQR